MSKVTVEFLGWRFLVNSYGVFKSTPSQGNYANIKTSVKDTWKRPMSTEARLKRIASQVRGWRQYHQYCDMSKHLLWSLNQWVWRKLRAEKHRLSEKAVEKQRKNAIKGFRPEGAAKRQLTTLQAKSAFPKVSWTVNKFVMVKGDKSPFDGDIAYWVNRNSKLYGGPLAQAMKRQKNKCGHCNRPFLEKDGAVELHHVDGDHNNWKPKNLVALHRPCHQAQSVHRFGSKEWSPTPSL